MSGVEDQLEITWPNTVTLAKFADQMEFEALVPVARWWGFGSANDPQGPGFEAYTLAADIAASTAWCGVVSTSHVSLNHPIIAAPMRRYRPHLQWPLHAQRRVQLERAGDGNVRHDRFYRIKKGCLKPKPLQKPYPAIMNAGALERGRHFAAKNCDLVSRSFARTISRSAPPISPPITGWRARNTDAQSGYYSLAIVLFFRLINALIKCQERRFNLVTHW
jgi:alkanesulfonate monooxygenase SsuD/methylene tetrahydromethanopterin reductase-like flavin-dependent oxidoreductase (luciferase family)